MHENTSDEAQNIVIGFPVARFNYDDGSPPSPHTPAGSEPGSMVRNTNIKTVNLTSTKSVARGGLSEMVFSTMRDIAFNNKVVLRAFIPLSCSGQESRSDTGPAKTRIERLLSEERRSVALLLTHQNSPQVEYKDVWTEHYIGNTTTYVRSVTA